MAKEIKLWEGNHLVAEAAIAAGCRFFAGYPITPSSEIAEYMAVRLPQVGGTFVQMEDEIASMGVIIGASLAGVKSMTATSGPGFSLKQENLGFACIAEIPVVVVNVMRGGPGLGNIQPSQADYNQVVKQAEIVLNWLEHLDVSQLDLSGLLEECQDLVFNLIRV